jgi:hypothetical protein
MIDSKQLMEVGMKKWLVLLVFFCSACPSEPAPRIRSCEKWERRNERSKYPTATCEQDAIKYTAFVESKEGDVLTEIPSGRDVIVAAYLENVGQADVVVSTSASRALEVRGPTGSGSSHRSCKKGEMTLSPGERATAARNPLTVGEFGVGNYIGVVGFISPEYCSICIEWSVTDP